MIVQLVLAMANPAFAQDIPNKIVDYATTFQTAPATNQLSGNYGWVSQYSADKWSVNEYFGSRYISAITDDAVASNNTWGLNKASNNMLIQTSDTGCGPTDTSPCTWSTLQLNVSYYNSDPTGHGVVFHWVDNSNFWIFEMARGDNAVNGTGGNTTLNGSRLYHVVNGQPTSETCTSSSTSALYQTGYLHILSTGSNVSVWNDWDGAGGAASLTQICSVNTLSPPVTGRVGMFCYDAGNVACSFDDISVSVPDTDKDGVGDPYDNCSSVGNVNQADLDGDKVGDLCDPDQDGDGVNAANGDCNDRVATIKPGATEVCDGVDQDCDSVIDDNPTNGTSYYADTDADGFGNPAVLLVSCSAVAGYSVNNTDCNDTSSTIRPGGTEICNTVDDNCDGLVDNNPINGTTFYRDADGDTFGTGTGPLSACVQPAGYADDALDCNDALATVNPNAPEVCNGVDDDCNLVIDDSYATGQSTFYADADDDGYGTDVSSKACFEPVGYAPASGDCNDAAAAVNPGESEVCNDIDDNCDGSVDNNATDAVVYYVDADGDGLGGVDTALPSCEVVPNTTLIGGDCDDSDPDVGVGTLLSLDADGDGFGAPGSSAIACPDSGYVDNTLDCNDDNRLINPDADERCGGADEDCDGLVDEPDAIGASTWYADADADGFGTDVSEIACAQPTGFARYGRDCDDVDPLYHPFAAESCDDPDFNCDGSTGEMDVDADGAIACEDCDDADPTTLPGGTEVCDEADNDCDGIVDGDAADAGAWYADLDGDGFGDAGSELLACEAPNGYVQDAADCDDTAADTFPGAPETCSDTSDKNCDGSFGQTDADDDGYAACEECNDADSGVNPGETEICNGFDDNCTGGIDESAGALGYVDADGDGFGDPATETDECGVEGLISVGGDCDDTNARISPVEVDVPGDGIDQDCDGSDPIIDDTDTGETDTDDGGGLFRGGSCGNCQTSGGAFGWIALVGLGLLTRRRRVSTPS